MRDHEPIAADLVLVGAGHAHVQVLRRFMMKPLSGVRLTLVVDHPLAVYSGMVPGLVAGDYAAHEIVIDGVPLARRARARVVLEAATRIDPVARCVEFHERPPIRYDLASLDVGSTVRGLDLPGVREHALATRPVARFSEALEARLAAAELQPAALSGRPLRLAVVGGGAAGAELAFCLEARLRE
ncbi:MAG: FAD-dependent oxidoreductase, partial [Myxococcales bacterium]|nr:FAD-dependent oxidoreductase [Myxococcales bacterium]